MNTGTTRSATRSGADDASDAVTALLRSAYAAPTEQAYWAGLEQRVVSRLRQNGPVTWWACFSEWRMAGMVAAALALLIAGAAVVREQVVLSNTRELAAGAAAFTVFDSTYDGVAIALTPVTGKRARLDAPERYIDVIKP